MIDYEFSIPMCNNSYLLDIFCKWHIHIYSKIHLLGRKFHKFFNSEATTTNIQLAKNVRGKIEIYFLLW